MPSGPLGPPLSVWAGFCRPGQLSSQPIVAPPTQGLSPAIPDRSPSSGIWSPSRSGKGAPARSCAKLCTAEPLFQVLGAPKVLRTPSSQSLSEA